jgi:prolyl-tRNA synthetase
VRVLFDDRRGVSPGVKFNDSELLGIPTIAVVGKGLADGVVELRDRKSGDQALVPVAEFVSEVVSLVTKK